VDIWKTLHYAPSLPHTHRLYYYYAFLNFSKGGDAIFKEMLSLVVNF